ncbi:MAG: heterodisulfide reductase-related iron-sulfur binding cluster [Myxococcota bacterium]
MRPESPPAFDPNDPRYWDPRDLERELERVFGVCHGCRMCVGFCPAFPELFKRVDQYVERGKGEVDAFIDQDYLAVNDLCYQCKLCYFRCPYTPDDDHPFMIDFPRLALRHRAQRSARDGVPLQDQALGEPQLLGRLGSGVAAPMANFVNANRLLRKVQEKVTGISAEFNLPPFAPQTFEKWLDGHQASKNAGREGEAVMFSTCTVNYNAPYAGRAAVQVLEHNGWAVLYPREQTCCGMPNLDGGDIDAARAKAERNVSVLYEHVKKGRPIVVPGPTCSYVLKEHHRDLLGDREDVRAVAEATHDLMEFFLELQKNKRLDRVYHQPLGTVAYHVPCHLRAQKIGFPAERVLRKVPDTDIERVEQCSAVDGTWGMKAQYYELGRTYAQKLVDDVRRVKYDAVATDCPLAGLRLEQELGVPPVHPVELLNDAYGLPPVRESKKEAP